jgi:GNAT superfamily N-acetyltransferase
MQSPGELNPASLGSNGRVELVVDCPVSFHRFLYREVGRNYSWRDRLTWTDDQVRSYLSDPAITLHVLYVQGSPAGYFELRLEPDQSVEIAYFGLLPEFIGRGLGKGLLSEAVRAAWDRGARRVWLHTCTLDDPAALPNYLRRGFRPFRDERYQTTI